MSVTATPTAPVARQPAPPIELRDESRRPGTPLLWFDGELASADSLQAPLTTHAMHYGSGVFEGIRAYATDDGAAVFRLPEHLERMRKGAEMFGLPFDAAQCALATLETLRANGHRDAYIRPLAWFGEGSFGLDVEGHVPHMMVATTATHVHLNGSRARLGVGSWRRNPADSLPPLKLCGGGWIPSFWKPARRLPPICAKWRTCGCSRPGATTSTLPLGTSFWKMGGLFPTSTRFLRLASSWTGISLLCPVCHGLGKDCS